jgi:hypothetical protein
MIAKTNTPKTGVKVFVIMKACATPGIVSAMVRGEPDRWAQSPGAATA